MHRKFRHLSFEHRKNRDLNKFIIKAINQDYNSYIGSNALLRWNRQSYDYDKNGNLVSNKKRGTKPKDLLKSFSKKGGMINNLEESSTSMAMVVNHLLK
ncbi:hypothetical protein [Faecalimicrobium sp. JNUCC 81]